MTTMTPFNSEFENSLRVILLLDLCDKPQTLDKLYTLDFITVYGKSFEITNYNLNGDNMYMFSEFVARREFVMHAIKLLVTNGMVIPISSNDGIGYKITGEGKKYADLLSCDYAKEYRKAAQKALKRFVSFSDMTIIKFISDKSLNSLRRAE
ncbi:MAG: hypothetical protein LUD47_01630 [Clostridia bacterium]|nr:hypothetical protein [Clostridia bacterium]